MRSLNRRSESFVNSGLVAIAAFVAAALTTIPARAQANCAQVTAQVTAAPLADAGNYFNISTSCNPPPDGGSQRGCYGN
jgi:hypothetical protein